MDSGDLAEGRELSLRKDGVDRFLAPWVDLSLRKDAIPEGDCGGGGKSTPIGPGRAILADDGRGRGVCEAAQGIEATTVDDEVR